MSTVLPERFRSRFLSRAEVVLVWLVGTARGHGLLSCLGCSRAVMAGAEANPAAGFRVALHGLDDGWLAAAAALTALNIGAMTLRRDRLQPYAIAVLRTWRFGAVAFAWSNFLTPVRWPDRRCDSGCIARRRSVVRPARRHRVRRNSLHIGLIGWTLAFSSEAASGRT